MAAKVPLLVIIDVDTAKTLRDKNARLTECPEFDTIPAPFKEAIRLFIMDNVGFSSGPIFALSRLNDEKVSLYSTGDSGYRMEDVLPHKTGDYMFELSMPEDMIVSIGVEKLFEIKEQGEVFGFDDEDILEMLKSELVVGIHVPGAANVFSFIPVIKQEHCSKFVRISENWEADYKDLFSNIQDISPSTLSMF